MHLCDPGHHPANSDASTDYRFDKPHAFAWSCGIPYLFTLEERYELAVDDGGTRLTHSCTLRGALSLPFAAMMLRRMRSLMVESDDRLATYLRWRVGQPARAINRQRVPFRYRRKAR